MTVFCVVVPSPNVTPNTRTPSFTRNFENSTNIKGGLVSTDVKGLSKITPLTRTGMGPGNRLFSSTIDGFYWLERV